MKQLFILIIIWAWALLVILSCTDKEKALQESLEQAKENRYALEQVLKHYAETDRNEEKLAAAKFLIANMRGHVSLDDDLLSAYADSLTYCSNTTSKEVIYRIWNHVKSERPKRKMSPF